MKVLTNRLLLILFCMLLSDNLLVSSSEFSRSATRCDVLSDEPLLRPKMIVGSIASSEGKREGKLLVTSSAASPYMYVLGQIQEGIKHGVPLNLVEFYDNFVAATSQNNWEEVNLTRAKSIGNKKVAAFELLTNILPTLDILAKTNPYTVNLFRTYIKRHLTSAYSNVRSSLKITPEQKKIMVRTLTYIGQQEAKQNPFQTKKAEHWFKEFLGTRKYNTLSPSLRRDIFLKTLIVYTAQEIERFPEEKNAEEQAIKEVSKFYKFDPGVSQSNLSGILKNFRKYIVTSLTDQHILDQRGVIVREIMGIAAKEAKQQRTVNLWKHKFLEGKNYDALDLFSQQDIFLKTLVSYTSQQKTLFSKDENAEVKAVQEVQSGGEFRFKITPENLLTQLKYFQKLGERISFSFDSDLGVDKRAIRQAKLALPNYEKALNELKDFSTEDVDETVDNLKGFIAEIIHKLPKSIIAAEAKELESSGKVAGETETFSDGHKVKGVESWVSTCIDHSADSKKFGKKLQVASNIAYIFLQLKELLDNDEGEETLRPIIRTMLDGSAGCEDRAMNALDRVMLLLCLAKEPTPEKYAEAILVMLKRFWVNAGVVKAIHEYQKETGDRGGMYWKQENIQTNTFYQLLVNKSFNLGLLMEKMVFPHAIAVLPGHRYEDSGSLHQQATINLALELATYENIIETFTDASRNKGADSCGKWWLDFCMRAFKKEFDKVFEDYEGGDYEAVQRNFLARKAIEVLRRIGVITI